MLFSRAGDSFSPDLFRIVANEQNADVVYCDEDILDLSNNSVSPWLKPDFSPELLLSVNYLKNAFFKRKLLHNLSQKDISEEYPGVDDLVFTGIENASVIVHISQILYHSQMAEKNEREVENNQRLISIRDHLLRIGETGAEVGLAENGEVHITFSTDSLPASIIIPTRDNLECLDQCISSILERTRYSNFEIVLLDTGSIRKETFLYYEGLKKYTNIRLYEDARPFNYSYINNWGAELSQGAVLVFLNNDVKIIDENWLFELAQWASKPEIGIVGAKLLYPDRKIQHAGIVMGMEGHASHVFGGDPECASGIFGSTEWYRNYYAVTGACMAMRRELFYTLGGFDVDYKLAFGDVELCMRAVEHGYRVLYNPFARLIHYEGKSRANFIPKEDIQVAGRRFRKVVQNGDPYFNANLSLAVRTPTLRRSGEENPLARLEKIMRWS